MREEHEDKDLVKGSDGCRKRVCSIGQTRHSPNTFATRLDMVPQFNNVVGILDGITPGVDVLLVLFVCASFQVALLELARSSIFVVIERPPARLCVAGLERRFLNVDLSHGTQQARRRRRELDRRAPRQTCVRSMGLGTTKTEEKMDELTEAAKVLSARRMARLFRLERMALERVERELGADEHGTLDDVCLVGR